MEFTNTFTVSAPMDRVWSVLTNAEEVAPCVPGAQITEMVDANHFKGTVKVKLGAVQMTYRGQMELTPDEAAHSLVLQGKGTEARGSGGASGKVTVRLTETGDGSTQVEMVSQVDVTGRVATFGRGIMQDVANRLIKEFAQCIEQKLQVPDQAESTETLPSTTGPAAAPELPPTQSDQPAQSSQAPESAAADSAPPPARRAPATLVPTESAPQPASELRVMELLAEVARTRIAAGLRTLADRIEPK